MATSVFDLFKIGIGPSSSHTVGPMLAAREFALEAAGLGERVAAVRVELFGSLAATGRGHGTDHAVVLGLLGERPDRVDPDAIPALVARVRERGLLALAGGREVLFRERDHLVFERRSLPFHPNGMRFTALDAAGGAVVARTSFSVGGGFVVREGEPRGAPARGGAPAPLPFRSAAELLARCAERGVTPAEVMRANEAALRPEAEVRAGLLRVWEAMQACVERGCRTEGVLPGGLGVPRRAPGLLRRLEAGAGADDPLAAMDRVSLWALAVNEENAAGSRASSGTRWPR